MPEIASIIKNNDINIFYFFNKKIHCRILDWLMKIITEMGSTTFTVLFSASFLLYSLDQGSFLAVNLIGSQFITQVVKRLVNRPRPYKALQWALAVKPPACQYSFPSGHTCAAFSLAFVLSSFFPMLKSIFLIIGSLVGISRIYLGCHYPTDVFIGFLIAFITFLLTLNF